MSDLLHAAIEAERNIVRPNQYHAKRKAHADMTYRKAEAIIVKALVCYSQTVLDAALERARRVCDSGGNLHEVVYHAVNIED